MTGPPVKTTSEPEKVAPPPPPPPLPTNKDTRPKTTLNLGNIGKVAKTAEEKPVSNGTERTPDKPINDDQLRKAWDEFTELRKNQVAEYTLLKREYSLKGNSVVVTLNNPVEEPLLMNMRTSLIAFLRDRLSNSSLMVVGELQEPTTTRKHIYTNKEKFEHLAEQNPVLKEMKERFGLDAEI